MQKKVSFARLTQLVLEYFFFFWLFVVGFGLILNRTVNFVGYIFIVQNNDVSRWFSSIFSCVCECGFVKEIIIFSWSFTGRRPENELSISSKDKTPSINCVRKIFIISCLAAGLYFGSLMLDLLVRFLWYQKVFVCFSFIFIARNYVQVHDEIYVADKFCKTLC